MGMTDRSGRGMLESQWTKVQELLRHEISEKAYSTWLAPLTLGDFREGRLRLALPTRFMRDWVSSHYVDRLRALWQRENTAVRSIEIVVQPTVAPVRKGPEIADAPSIDAAPSSGALPASMPRVGPSVSRSPDRAYDDLLGGPDARFTFDNFVVGKPNEFAYAAARRIAETDSPAFNPLFLYGGVGLGKTHLMHAIWQAIRERNAQRRVLYLSAETFVNKFIQALRSKNTISFKEQFRGVDVLMVDDVQFICGKDTSQEEFFHTFNALVDQNKQIVLSSDKAPQELDGIEDRMRSRLSHGLVADIHATTYELRLGILQSKAEQTKVQVPERVLEFLAHKITSNVRELEGALNRVIAHATLVNREITLDAAQEVLHDVLRAADRRISIEEIQLRVSQHYSIKIAEMGSPRRSRSVARPRQVAMYLAKQLTQCSLPQIGRKFGNRDHTTVMHAVRKIEELRASDATINEDVELLRKMLQG
ncbi:MAG: chromosomal replication initiator protein DnaA [Rhodospirillales bacterium]|nr:chromosomal replication initiator protein DnaA [Rhodospirillales bacterium]QQS10564.1 MAG: chromosomal replication initiator protein DnaA [Rhodospirillales bacterium]